MMGRILGKHPEIYTFGELHFFGQLWAPASKESHAPIGTLSEQKTVELAAKLLCIQRAGYRTHGNFREFVAEAEDFLAELPEYPKTPAQLFSTFLRYETFRNGKTIPCDQTPRNVFYIEDILRFYPQAKVINMIRDPRDVLLSQKRKWKRRFLGGSDMPIKETFRDWINYHPITISRIWHTAITAADKFVDNERVASIYFEKLLTYPEETVSHLCDFVGIEYSASLLKVPQVGSSVNTDKPQQLGINSNRANNWQNRSNREQEIAPTRGSKLSSAEIYINQKLNRALMEKHSYVPISIRPNILRLTVSILSFPIKLVGAFVCNLDRIKNIRETLKRRL